MMYEQDPKTEIDPMNMDPNYHYYSADNDTEFVNHAETQATLALAFEQRTANLIALAAQDNRGYVAKRGLWQTIEARLGL